MLVGMAVLLPGILMEVEAAVEEEEEAAAAGPVQMLTLSTMAVHRLS